MVSDESVPLYYSVSYLVGTVLGTFLFGVMASQQTMEGF